MTYHRQILHIYGFFLFSTSDSKQSTDIGLPLSARSPGGLVCSAEPSWLRTQPASEDLESRACLPPLCFGDGPHITQHPLGARKAMESSVPRPREGRKALSSRTVTANTQCQKPVLPTHWVLPTANTTDIPILQMGRLRSREIKQLTQGHAPSIVSQGPSPLKSLKPSKGKGRNKRRMGEIMEVGREAERKY